VVVAARHAVILSEDGELAEVSFAEAARLLGRTPALVCHARALARRLGLGSLKACDLLELFAFVHPARFCLPTPRGLAEALELPLPQTLDDQVLTLAAAAHQLLEQLTAADRPEERSDPVGIAWAMGLSGWPWAPLVLAALGQPNGPESSRNRALEVWRTLPEWASDAPEPPPGQHAVEPAEARQRLAALLDSSARRQGFGPAAAEPRPQQSDYASAVSLAFTPRAQPGTPNLVLAEAGTGVGKTLGYLAPATLWAEKNQGTVWISTYTRNLQRQIDSELDRLHPDPAVKARRVVVRKGRENYLCLLNYQDAVGALGLFPRYGPSLGLMARWIAVTRDGDLQGGDLPGWLVDLIGRGATLGLADRRGECVFSACDHYNRCFIEKSIRRARRAEIVIANHALVMLQAALEGGEDATVPTRYVFDEGHHVFDAADNAFAAHLTGLETAELRRWLLGAEGGGRSRARGLKRRVEDVLGGDDEALNALEGVLEAARALPGEGWAARLAGESFNGPSEQFLALVRRQVLARAPGTGSPFSLETETTAPIEGLIEAARALDQALEQLAGPLTALAGALAARLDDEAAELDGDQRRRLDALGRSLQRRAILLVAAWRAMLQSLGGSTPAGLVDWFGIERQDGRDLDLGFYRHYVDPTVPFAATLGPQAHGLVITSATLTDGTGEPEQDWQVAEQRTGAVHLARPALRAKVPSPFDYRAQTRVLVVNDVRKDDLAQVAAAYRELFLAAGGGGLGLFTAIGRLRAVHERIAEPLDQAGLALYAQHVDGLDLPTLIDIFRAEDHACLLGTDAVRDGVDVPGRSLRLIVFDRVPWARPDLLHRARRDAFGGRRYDDLIARLRLRQAFGRLVRRADDVGVFVLLDPMMPSRLAGAFPEGVAIERIGLAEAVQITRAFLELHKPQAEDQNRT